jgi:hypothetical protein
MNFFTFISYVVSLQSKQPLLETVVETKSLLTKKSCTKPNSTTVAEIFSAYRLRVTHKLLMKLRRCWPKKKNPNPILRLMLKSSAHIYYCWLRNSWKKLSPCWPKNHPRNPDLCLTLTSSEHIEYCWRRNCWQKLNRCRPRNHLRNLVLRQTLKSSSEPSSTADT